MNTCVRRLDWDSEFLGFPVGCLQAGALSAAGLQQQLTAARAAGYRLLYWSVNPDDAESAASAQAAGAQLADRKIRVVQPVTEGPLPLPEYIFPAVELTQKLEELAVQASEHSRFRLDPGFAPDVAARLYTRWLHRAFAQELAREVLVYQPQPARPAAGLLIMGVTGTRAEMIMMAVDTAWRGQGIGSVFIEAARRRARAWDRSGLQLVTQATNPACRLYEREGFRLEHTEHVFHLWL